MTKKGAILTTLGTEPPNDGYNLDSTRTTSSAPIPFDSPASRIRGALQKLASRGQLFLF